MKPMMHPDLIEATRLTREGRLTEATALIQRILQSGLEPDASTGEPRAVADAPQIAAGPIIELTPEVIEESARRRSSPPGRAASALAVTSTRVQAQGGREAPRPDPRKDIPEKMEPDSSSRGSSQGDGSLSDRLGRTDGVITPPSDTTPSMTVPHLCPILARRL
jgi:hypothetical protein